MVLADALARGEVLLAELDDGVALERHATQLLRVLFDEPGAYLLAASPPAERLVGAALILAHGGVSGWRPGPARTAVICDVMLASGDSLTRAAARVRRQGADRVVAVVLSDPWGWAQVRVPDVDSIFVLEAETGVPEVRGHRGLSLVG
jgi:hypothetical protein